MIGIDEVIGETTIVYEGDNASIRTSDRGFIFNISDDLVEIGFYGFKDKTEDVFGHMRMVTTIFVEHSQYASEDEIDYTKLSEKINSIAWTDDCVFAVIVKLRSYDVLSMERILGAIECTDITLN